MVSYALLVYKDSLSKLALQVSPKPSTVQEVWKYGGIFPRISYLLPGQFITHTPDVQDEFRISRVVFKLLADIGNMAVNGTQGDHGSESR